MLRHAVALVLLLGSGMAAAADPSAVDLQSLPVRTITYWSSRDHRDRPLEQKVQLAPAELVDYLRKANLAQGYAERPEGAKADAAVQADFRKAILGIPRTARNFLNRQMIGIFLVKNLGTTGFTSKIFAPDHQRVAGYITIIGMDLIRLSANEWATWKERTPFKPDPAYALVAELEGAQEDSRAAMIQYILLHEFGHVVGNEFSAHPDWDRPAGPSNSPLEHPFSAVSWSLGPQGAAGREDATFNWRSQVKYYRGAESQLPGAVMAAVYEQLDRSDFPTLYAAMNPADDFAESFANFIHVMILRRPFRIRIFQGKSLLKSYESCWDEPRCEKKRAELVKILTSPRFMGSGKP